MNARVSGGELRFRISRGELRELLQKGVLSVGIPPAEKKSWMCFSVKTTEKSLELMGREGAVTLEVPIKLLQNALTGPPAKEPLCRFQANSSLTVIFEIDLFT